MFFFLPYGINRRITRFPMVTFAFIAMNVVMYIVLLPLDHNMAIAAAGLIPSHPSLATIVTSMFMHSGILHLMGNMLFLWLFGPSVEDALGHLEFALFYLGSGFAAAFLHLFMVQAFTPTAADNPYIGASGAVAGILGIFAIRFYKTKIEGLGFTIPAMYGLGIWFIYQFIMGMVSLSNLNDPKSGGTAYWAHIGGMLFGMALAYMMKLGKEGSKEYLIDDARARLDQGATWIAAENLKAVLEQDPNNAEIHGQLACTYAAQQDMDDSIAHYNKCIELCLSKGDTDKAIERFGEFKQYHQEKCLDLQSAFKLAKCLLDKGSNDAALCLFKGIALHNTGKPEAEISLMKVADLLLNVFSNPSEAVEYYKKFLSVYPDSEFRPAVEKSLAESISKLQS